MREGMMSCSRRVERPWKEEYEQRAVVGRKVRGLKRVMEGEAVVARLKHGLERVAEERDMRKVSQARGQGEQRMCCHRLQVVEERKQQALVVAVPEKGEHAEPMVERSWGGRGTGAEGMQHHKCTQQSHTSKHTDAGLTQTRRCSHRCCKSACHTSLRMSPSHLARRRTLATR